MSPKHKELIERYWDAVEYGSTDEQFCAGAALEEFEYQGYGDGSIEEKGILLKYVLVFE